jgi:hypothetical protein
MASRPSGQLDSRGRSSSGSKRGAPSICSHSAIVMRGRGPSCSAAPQPSDPPPNTAAPTASTRNPEPAARDTRRIRNGPIINRCQASDVPRENGWIFAVAPGEPCHPGAWRWRNQPSRQAVRRPVSSATPGRTRDEGRRVTRILARRSSDRAAQKGTTCNELRTRPNPRAPPRSRRIRSALCAAAAARRDGIQRSGSRSA